MPIQPEVFSTEAVFSSTTGRGYQFGFTANYVRVENGGGSPVYANLNSTTTSTGSERVEPLGVRVWDHIQTTRMSLSSTSTTTSTGASALTRRVLVHATL